MTSRRSFQLLSAFLLAVLPVFTATATTYHVNRGTKWHVGNSNVHRTGGDFEGAQAKVGPTWVQPFRLSESDQVEVQINNVWSLDARAYQSSLVYINDEPLGEFSGSGLNSYVSSRSVELKAGRTYLLKIRALGNAKEDDFTFEDVIIRTAHGAEVTLAGPPSIETNLLPVAGACDKLDEQRGVGYGLDANPNFRLEANAEEFSSSEPLAEMAPGQTASFQFTVRDVLKVDKVSQPFEILAVQEDKASGWVLSFGLGSDAIVHANVLRRGTYSTDLFTLDSYQPRQWNLATITYCRDNTVHLFINKKSVAQTFVNMSGNFMLQIRAQGLLVETYKAPTQVASSQVFSQPQ